MLRLLLKASYLPKFEELLTIHYLPVSDQEMYYMDISPSVTTPTTP